jgi:hypothetical protein
MVNIFDEVIAVSYFVNTYLNKIKKVELLPPFLPQIYHKLNLLMLWYFKSIVAFHFYQRNKMNGKKNR